MAQCGRKNCGKRSSSSGMATGRRRGARWRRISTGPRPTSRTPRAAAPFWLSIPRFGSSSARMLAPSLRIFVFIWMRCFIGNFRRILVDVRSVWRDTYFFCDAVQCGEILVTTEVTTMLIIAIVLLQIWTATLMQDAAWPVVITVAYFFGAFLNHNLFLAIHELSHNLAFSTVVYNRLLGIFANLPISIPMSVTFQKYHLEHHKYQGVQGMDMDIPTYTEGWVVTNIFWKMAWVLCQLFFYALRPVFLNPKQPGFWEVLNLICQLAFDAVLFYYSGVKALAYLLLATFLGGGMHPMAGHFIAEHYVFLKGQETYSYYGPFNIFTWNVGYHVEHHDFPRIPGFKLYRVRQIASEFYEDLGHHTSWSYVIYKYITDAAVGPFSRTMRKPQPVSSKSKLNCKLN